MLGRFGVVHLWQRAFFEQKVEQRQRRCLADVVGARLESQTPDGKAFAGDLTAVRDSHIIAVVGRLSPGATRTSGRVSERFTFQPSSVAMAAKLPYWERTGQLYEESEDGEQYRWGTVVEAIPAERLAR